MFHYLLIQKKEDRFLAHCLDFDLIVAGPTLEEATRRLDAMITSYVERAYETSDYAALMTVAPERYWEQFADADVLPGHHLEIRVPEVVPMAESTGRVRVQASCAAPIAA